MADMTAAEALKYLAGMRVFVTSRELAKAPEGCELFDDAIRAIDAHLARMGEPVGTLRIRINDWKIAGIPNAMTTLRSGEYPLYTAPPASGDWDRVREVIAELQLAAPKRPSAYDLADKLTAALPESKP